VHKNIFIPFLIFILLPACTSQVKYKSEIKWDHELFERDPKQSGIFVDAEEAIFIKVKNEKFVNIIDNLAYKMRFNYTLSTKIYQYRLTISSNNMAQTKNKNWNDVNQLKFRSIKHFFYYAIKQINTQYYKSKKKLGYLWVGDGPEFFETVKKNNRLYLKKSVNIVKKIFFNSLAVKEMDRVQNIGDPLSGYTGTDSENNPDLTNPSLTQTQTQPSSFIKDKIINLLLSEIEKQQVKIIEMENQNALVLHGNRKTIDKISNLISLIDIDYPHVLVETKVFEYDNSLIKEKGFKIKYNKKDAETKEEDIWSVDSIPAIKETDTIPIVAFQYLNAEKRMQILTQLAFSDTNDKVKLLAEPRLLIKPGSFAKIHLTASKYIEYKTDDGETEKPEPIETGIKFEITPYIIGVNKIMMDVMVEQSEFIPNEEKKVLLFSSKNIIDTRVIAHDGELISLGGIIANKKTSTSNRIPYLSDIPILGYFFKYENKTKSTKRIEFLIRPTTRFIYNRLDELKDEINNLDMELMD